MSKKGDRHLFTFLTGALAGIVLGILYAPDKGISTREKLSFQLVKYKKILEDYIKDIVEGKNSSLVAEAKSLGDHIVSETKEKAERLLEDMDELLDQIRGDKNTH